MIAERERKNGKIDDIQKCEVINTAEKKHTRKKRIEDEHNILIISLSAK